MTRVNERVKKTNGCSCVHGPSNLHRRPLATCTNPTEQASDECKQTTQDVPTERTGLHPHNTHWYATAWKSLISTPRDAATACRTSSVSNSAATSLLMGCTWLMPPGRPPGRPSAVTARASVTSASAAKATVEDFIAEERWGQEPQNDEWKTRGKVPCVYVLETRSTGSSAKVNYSDVITGTVVFSACKCVAHEWLLGGHTKKQDARQGSRCLGCLSGGRQRSHLRPGPLHHLRQQHVRS